MHVTEMDRLIEVACHTAMDACARYSQSYSMNEAQIDFAIMKMRADVKAEFDAAIDEFHNAQKVNMRQIGMASFKATFVLIGVKAAQAARTLTPATKEVSHEN